MKKVISLFVAMLVLLSVGVPAFANTKGNIIIKNTTANTGITLTNEKYYAYKVMDLVGSSGGNPQGYTIDQDFKKFFKDKANKSNPIVAVDTDDKLNKFANDYLNKNKDNMIEVAREIKKYIDAENNTTVTIVKDGENGTISNDGAVQTTTIPDLDHGYYIIIDKTTTEAEHVIAAAALGTNFPGLEIQLKASKPTLDKKIFHNELGTWGNVGDNAIGEKVEFRLAGKLPQNITGYKNYTYLMHDTLDKGLTFNDDIQVYVGEKNATSVPLVLGTDYTIEKNVKHNHNNKDYITSGKTGFDLSINIREGVVASKFKLGDTLYVYYSATLNKDAVIAGFSNDNSVYLEYSNNPYDENSKEEGPEIVVKDYTFKLNGLKTNTKGDVLKGAEFNILIGTEPIKFKLVNGTNDYIVSKDADAIDTITSGTNGKFNIIGLDDAVVYTLRETKAPFGYNTISDKNFTITAGYDGNGIINSLSANTESGITNIVGTYELGTTIVNTKSELLPETGGMGTTLFNIAGVSLMTTALGLLVFKRRKKVS